MKLNIVNASARHENESSKRRQSTTKKTKISKGNLVRENM